MKTNNKSYSIGIDIGGTKMAAILFDGANIISDYVLATPKDTLEHFMIMLNALIEPLIEKAQKDKVKIKGIGLGVAGVMDYKERKVLVSPNLRIIEGVKLASQLEIKTGFPVFIDNDGNCFIRAEAKIGSGNKYHNLYGITIGTGIGGGWWINNEIYQGAHGGAGEPSVMVIDSQSGMNLETAYQKLIQNNAANAADEAYHGDILAEKKFEEFGDMLGVALANIANIVDPEAFIIGGGAAEASDLFLANTKKSMLKLIESTESKKRIKILKSKLGKNAGAIGAALLVN